jgi:curli biogenesis system outer membrane secretion channel CsgG
MRIVLLGLLFFCLSGAARADVVHIDAEGIGTTSEMAVSKALVSAIEQATGVSIDVAQLSATMAASVATNTSQDTMMVASAQEAISRKAGGTIRSYRISSLMPAPEGGFAAQVGVEIEVFRAKGPSNEARRRIAVAPFDDGGAHAVGSQLRDSLLAYLTQTRRFAVVDRADDAVYAREMALVTSPDAASYERARAGQVIGADYVVTGKLSIVASRTTEQVIELTGERVQHTTAGSASADFQVIEIATRQIKWANRIILSSEGDPSLMAARIGADITQTIYPMRLIKFDDPKALVINEGGMGLKPGQRLREMLLGEALVDPYTNESLGQTEQEIGIIEISDVQSKVSYARLVLGRLPGPNQDVVLRSFSQKPAAPPRRPAASTTATAPTAGIKLPFDR